ncbi:MAG: arginine--tRNA ligase [Candidatus Woesearchaeota archaeon]
MDFKEHIAELLHHDLGLEKKSLLELIEVPNDQQLGDYALPCFLFAKKLKKSPAAIALELQDKLIAKHLVKGHPHIERIIATGPYLNFFVNKNTLVSSTLKNIMQKKECYGSQEKMPTIVLIESPGPNTNKPLHLGHLRNMLLGQSLANILRFAGKEVHIVNVVNDRGVHICKSMLAYQRLGNGATPQSTGRKPDHFVGDYYVAYSKLEESDANVEKDIQSMLLKWEEHDSEIRSLWKKMNTWALQGFQETYNKLNFTIEKEYFESETYLGGKEIILDGLKKGIFQKDETGAVIIDLEPQNLGKKVLLRSNGTSVYITQDIYMAHLRHQDYHFDEMVYVVGNEQEYHFKVLFEVFKKLGWSFGEKCYHFSYGMIELPEGKMKSREGNVVDTDALIEQVSAIAREELEKRYEHLPTGEIEKRAQIITMSALRFFFLKFDPLRNFVFNPKESVSFDGETGPYIEYSYARINSIFRKLAKDKEVTDIESFIAHPSLELLIETNELELVKILAKYPQVIESSAFEFKPSTLARYLLELTQKFNEFYHAHPILIAEEKVMKARLALIYCIREVLSSGMKLLGIEPIEEM